MEGIALQTGEDLARIREGAPLIHQITNYVVATQSANLTLALGASPVMAHAPEEVEEMAAMSGALILNIGTLDAEQVEGMLLAGRAANEAGVPVIIDPVGVGATRFRATVTAGLLEALDTTILRGNGGEIAFLAGQEGGSKGVDSILEGDPVEAADRIALHNDMVVACTGERDLVSDGSRRYIISGGHPLMGRTTGFGCMTTVMTACFAAVQPDPYLAAVEGLALFAAAGERAAAKAGGPGTLAAMIIDELNGIGPDEADALVNERVRAAG